MSTNKQNQTEILKELGIGAEPSEFDGMSAAELTAEEKRLDVHLKRLELAERLEKSEAKKAKIRENKERFEGAMRTIAMQLARRRAVQRDCSHRKGGQGVDAVVYGQGTDENYALIKHQLPSGDWMVTCQRCLGEWLPANRFTGEPATVIGGFTYRDALMARTDNSPSKSAVFRFDDYRSPEQIEADAWHPAKNEKGELVPDTRALPPGDGGPLQPPAPSSRRG